MLLQRKKACFTLEIAVKHAFFVVLSVFQKMPIAKKAVYSPAVALYPFLQGTCPPKTKNSLRNEFSWERKNGTKKIEGLKDSLQSKASQAPSGRIEGLRGASTFQSFQSFNFSIKILWFQESFCNFANGTEHKRLYG